jgi:hypothetical protein
MRHTLRIVSALFLLIIFLVSSGQGQNDRPRVFHSAEVLSASNVGIPYNSVANGMVELYLAISDTGKVEDIRVVRPLASVTEQSVRAVKTWSFVPARMHGKPVTSQLTVCVVFCPTLLTTLDMPLPPLADESQRDASAGALAFTSPEVIAATYPPDGGAGRVVTGTIVLRVLVEPDGKPSLVRVVRDIPSLTAPALVTIKDWKFSPASLNGKNVASGIIVAFAFREPLANSY